MVHNQQILLKIFYLKLEFGLNIKLQKLLKLKNLQLKDGTVRTYEINPADYGFQPGSMADYAGGTPAENAAITLRILQGQEQGPKRDIVLLNAGAALYVGNKAESIEAGIQLAKEMIDSGKALQKLQQLVAETKELGA